MKNENTRRTELHLHTALSDDSSVITPEELIKHGVKEGFSAVAVTDRNSVQSFYDIAKYREEYGKSIKVIYGAEVRFKGDLVTILAKDKIGLKALYKIISEKEITSEERTHVLIGSGNPEGALFSAVKKGKHKKLSEIGVECDYIELFVSDNKDVQAVNKVLFDFGKSRGIPVTAVGNCHYIEVRDKICKDVLDFAKGKTAEDTPSHFRTTEEMLSAFSYLGKEGALETVISNPEKIAHSIDFIDPTDNTLPSFTLDNAKAETERLCKERLNDLYGKNHPEEISQRLCGELTLLNDSQCSIYLLCHKLSQHLNKAGTLHSCRGTVGSTLTAYLMEISSINPLPSHYRCPECKYTEFTEEADGFDLPARICPRCSKPMKIDGHNIPFETCLGLKGSGGFSIDIVTSDSACDEAVGYVARYLGEDRVASAGRVIYCRHRFIEEAVSAFEKHTGIKLNDAEVHRISEKLLSTKRLNSTHPAGFVILPEGAEWEDITPIKTTEPTFGNIKTATLTDYFSMADRLHKINISGYEVYDKIQRLFQITRTNPKDISFNDSEVLKLFSNMDFGDIPELSHEIFGEIFGRICEKHESVNFNTLVKALSMAHGTNVWRNNGEALIINHPFSQLIGSRDDIYLTLLNHGIDREVAHTITEKVRKGKFTLKSRENEKLKEVMRSAGLPSWYIDSMTRIYYLFPKSHAVRYAKSAFICGWFKVYFPKEFYLVMKS